MVIPRWGHTVSVPGNIITCESTDLLPAPVNHLVKYEAHQFNRSRGDDKTPFQGWPSDEIDRTWQDSYLREYLNPNPNPPPYPFHLTHIP